MTPEAARELLKNATPGPWEWREGKDQDGEFVALRGPDGSDALRTWDGDLYASGVHGTDADKALAAAAPTLAAMIAGMREEWGVSYQRVSYQRDHENEKRTTWGWETQEDAERSMRLMTDVHVYGIVRRYVTTEEEE